MHSLRIKWRPGRVRTVYRCPQNPLIIPGQVNRIKLGLPVLPFRAGREFLKISQNPAVRRPSRPLNVIGGGNQALARPVRTDHTDIKLALIDPARYDSMSPLRDEMIDIIEDDLDKTEYPVWASRDDQFEFIGSQLVVFNTHVSINIHLEMGDMLSRMSSGSIFFHFIDGRRRNENEMDDFRKWLMQFDDQYNGLLEQLDEIDPYFSSLTELRTNLTGAFTAYFREN